jgi:predicted amidohydrolase YtcJ
VPTERISDTRVLLTLLGGKVVFDAGKVGGGRPTP